MNDIVTELIKLVLAIVAPILSALIVGLAYKAFQRMGLTVSAEQRARLEHLVAALVAQTEEWASSRIKAGLPVTAEQKAQYYLQLATDRLPGISSDEAHALAQTILGRIRLGTTAVLQDVRVAATTGAK
jgi:hypothetical protein